MAELNLSFGVEFADLYDQEGLQRLDTEYGKWLESQNAELAGRLKAARLDPGALASDATADLIVELAPSVEGFIAELFGVQSEISAATDQHHDLAPLFACKRLFVQRVAVKKIKGDAAAEVDGDALAGELESAFGETFGGDEMVFARHVMAWQQAAEEGDESRAEDFDRAIKYAAWATQAPEGRARHGDGILFQVPGKVDYDHLVPLGETKIKGLDGDVSASVLGEGHDLRKREGFALTDQGCDLTGALDHANYCIFCHNQDKDSCNKGLREKVARDAPEGTVGDFKKSPFGVTLNGCPLEERISEMHLVKTQGYGLGALAIIALDNPLCAATGHRICNDCMKSCIYQRQDPVDIPQAETRILKDILDLPWGFEIYSLLTRWNPLNFGLPSPRSSSGRRVLIVGLGPAGFSLAHNLMNDGHAVVGIDGLKIEPLPEDISGVAADGGRVPFRPIHDVNELYEGLGERVMAGFGGVAEYGITVRWNKNFLKIIRLLLERRSQFAMSGGIRFGGTITLDDAFERGFDHVALAMGAGKPNVLDMPGGLSRGVRTASDFLMALQLTGAARKDTLANMQLRLPVIVVGGGLTAVDTATEALAYYPVQVEKFLSRFDELCADLGEDAVRAAWIGEEAEISEEFISHARSVRAERERAAAAGDAPNILDLLNQWGGVTLCYRKRMLEAPSYTLNHEEIHKALEEGIRFAELLSPVEVEIDGEGHAKAVRFAHQQYDEESGFSATGEEVTLPARAVLVAAGTSPNTVLAREDTKNMSIDGKFFQAIDEAGNPVSPERVKKPNEVQVLAVKRDDGRFVSFFGDLHPSYAGNVVSAMASAKQGSPIVSNLLSNREPAGGGDDGAFPETFNEDFRASVHEVIRLTPNIVEVVVRAPAAARAFKPGQFYRLQNFETIARTYKGTTLAMEGIALTGAWVDQDAGLIGMIVLEMGGSSDLCAHLEVGEPVIVMGPTGMPTETPGNETVLLAGGGLGNAVLFSIGQAFRAAGSKVLYFAGYKAVIDRYKVADIEAAADVIVWCCDEAPGFEPSRPQDRMFVGNIVECMKAYASGELGEATIPMSDVDRIVAIGSDRMMAAVGASRHSVLEPFLKAGHEAVGSINSPMQCMMKEICAQCLQPHVDPETGERSVVFSCFNQDQPLDVVDFAGLNTRLRQNAVHEKLTKMWIDRCLAGLDVRQSRLRA